MNLHDCHEVGVVSVFSHYSVGGYQPLPGFQYFRTGGQEPE